MPGAGRTTISHAVSLARQLIAGNGIPLPAAAPPPGTRLRTPAELLQYAGATGIDLTIPQIRPCTPKYSRRRRAEPRDAPETANVVLCCTEVRDVRTAACTHRPQSKHSRTPPDLRIIPADRQAGGLASMRTFQEVFDYYQAVIYQRDTLTDAVAKLLRATRSARILDCACGTGLPALDLRARGFNVDCSDADGLMLRQFRQNARSRGVDDSAFHLRWHDLAQLGAAYDYVMCRGNSLAYANSWEEAAAPAASLTAIEHNVKEIAATLAPGGYLHIDVPKMIGVADVSYPETTFRGERVRVREQVTATLNYRRWEQRVLIGAREYCFTRNSSILTAIQLSGILKRIGFQNVKAVRLAGERPSYQVLLARKGRMQPKSRITKANKRGAR